MIRNLQDVDELIKCINKKDYAIRVEMPNQGEFWMIYTKKDDQGFYQWTENILNKKGKNCTSLDITELKKFLWKYRKGLNPNKNTRAVGMNDTKRF